jgi:hypothetical protein
MDPKNLTAPSFAPVARKLHERNKSYTHLPITKDDMEIIRSIKKSPSITKPKHFRNKTHGGI